MNIATLLLSPGMYPFAIALSIVIGMLLLELMMTLVGGSLLGSDVEMGSEVDIEAGIDAETAADIWADMDVGAGAAPDMAEAADLNTNPHSPVASALSWLGIGETPFAIWLAGVLTAFGLGGYALQLGTQTIVGAQLPAGIAALIALPTGLIVGARVARFLGKLVPKFETTAISQRSYGGRRGVITVGTARRGRPAQARFRDGHGNWHHAMVEPLHDQGTLTQGTEIAILRQRDGTLYAFQIDDNNGNS